MPDYYELLRISPLASRHQVARAYRRRAVAHHRNRVIQLEDQLELMRRAFETLSDPARRREYDAKLQTALAPAQRAEDARYRREGQKRVEISREIGLASQRLSERSVAASADQMRALGDEQDLYEAREALVRHRRELLRKGLTLLLVCALFALAWYLLRTTHPGG